MKKFSVIFLVLMIAVVSLAGVSITSKQDNSQYLRIHIRANSNSQIDQSVKYKVKEKVVDYLTPLLVDAKTKVKAQEILSRKLTEIEAICNRELRTQGYTYSSRASLRNEKFPTRVYEQVTLESGYYDALIIELGQGKGDNWWCVVYPPLCFTTCNSRYEYKSKIQQIINDFFK